PGKDGIPAIDNPRFVLPDRALLKAEDRVLGVFFNGVAKAYPVKILNWHEIVNDDFGGHPVAVTYCPLCASGVAYSALVGGSRQTFGVSGLLYNSDVLLYDRETGSLWSQLMNRAVTGPLKGAKLETVPLSNTTWEDWRNRHPDTRVLSENTGFARDYGVDPYRDYRLDRSLWFPVKEIDIRYHPKEMVLGAEIGGRFRAYPFAEMAGMPIKFNDEIGGAPVTVRFDRKHRTANVYRPDGSELPSVITYWFAWRAFHPDTTLFEAPK
ncbi:MAG: DUF3179 domain-containing protein, partial [Gammaproteobacteria bacterium]